MHGVYRFPRTIERQVGFDHALVAFVWSVSVVTFPGFTAFLAPCVIPVLIDWLSASLAQSRHAVFVGFRPVALHPMRHASILKQKLLLDSVFRNADTLSLCFGCFGQ